MNKYAKNSQTDFLANPTGQFKSLADQAKRHQVLSDKVMSLLQPDMAGFCRFGNINGSRLTMLCASSTWATKLRYISTDFLANVNLTLGTEVTDIQINIDPELFFDAARFDSPAAELSSTTGEHLKSVADTTDDPALKALFERLAENAKREK